MTLEQVYKILAKHGDKIGPSDYFELAKAINEHGFSEWKKGREDLKKIYKIK